MAENDKICLFTLGNSQVGKTCFILRYTKNTFNSTYISTIGIDFLAKDVSIPIGEKYKVLFYDTAGQEKYRSIAFNERGSRNYPNV